MIGADVHRPLVPWIALALGTLALAAGLTLAAPPAGAQSDDTTTTTVSPFDDPDAQLPTGNILPRPNSGQAPESAGDPGGWMQYMVFALIFAGLALIVVLVVRESRKARSAAGRP